MVVRLPRPWLDGRRVASVPPFGDLSPGVFETLRCEAGVPLLLAAHLARMEHGARALGIAWPPPWDPDAALHALASEAEGLVLRLTWSPPHLALVARALPNVPQEPTLLVLAPGAIALPRPAGVKSTQRAAYDAARMRAQAARAFEALVRASDGQCIEGTITNLFVARAGELRTPPLSSGCLPGTVRALLLEGAAEPLHDAVGRAWRLVEGRIEADDLARAEEILLTNALLGVLGIARLSGAELGREDLPGSRGPVARALHARVRRDEA